MTRLATTPGLFPLPDWAKTDLIQLKGKQKEDLIHGDEGPEIQEVYDRARKEVIDLQAECNLDRIVEGQLRWDDMLCHPLSVHKRVQMDGLQRYYDNNNFYREAVVKDTLQPTGDIASELGAATEYTSPDALQAVLPGPYSLSELATNDTGTTQTTFLQDLAQFLAGEIERFPSPPTLFLLEPSLATAPPDELENAIAGLQTVANAAVEQGIEDVIVHTYWDVPSSPVYQALMDVDGIGIGIDCVHNADTALQRIRDDGAPKTLALGIVDGQNTRLESLDEIESLLASVKDATANRERTYVTTNTELFYLPVDRAVDKLAILGRAADPAEVSI